MMKEQCLGKETMSDEAYESLINEIDMLHKKIERITERLKEVRSTAGSMNTIIIKNQCGCDLCKRTRRYLDIVSRLPEDEQTWMLGILDRLMDVEERLIFTKVDYDK